MPECQYCEKEFGNAGAKTNHENSCDEAPDEEPVEEETPTATVQEPEPEPQQAQPPARQQQPAQESQNLPAQQGSGNGAIDTGMQLGSALAGANSDDPGQQAQAKGEVIKMAGAAVAKLGEHAAQKGLERHRNAQENAHRETKVSDDYPRCAECNGQITQMPDEQPFQCGHCGTMLEFE